MSMPKATLAHRFQWALIAGALRGTDLLGDEGAGRVGALLARLGHSPVRLRRKVVEEQLRAAFPDRDSAWIEATSRAAYEHLGREMVAMLRMSRLRPEQLVERTDIVGLEPVLAAVQANRGVVIAAGHLGNWELGAAMLAVRGVPIDVIAQRQRNPYFDRVIIEARERLGMRVIERGQAPRLALRSLRQGKLVAFVADQNAGPTGVFVPFFGRLASTHRGPALMALRTGAPIFLAVPVRVPGGRYRMTLEEIVADREGEQEAVIERLTAAFTAGLERAIRKFPEQYLWHHRRWKTRPPVDSARELGTTG
jgi:Kdo2-lipid IVA lauroyltransferase/acyltransferase